MSIDLHRTPAEGIYAGAMTFSGKILRSIVVFSMGAILSYGFSQKRTANRKAR